MKIIDYIQNIIIWLTLSFMLISSFTFFIAHLGLSPLNGRLIGIILFIPFTILYNRLKIKEEE